MSIDVEHEELIHFPDATRAFPGKKLSLQTLHRWRLHGVRGVKLETCLVGSLRYTSKQAILRFVEAQNVSDSPEKNPGLTPSQRAKQSEAARIELQKMGIGADADSAERRRRPSDPNGDGGTSN